VGDTDAGQAFVKFQITAPAGSQLPLGTPVLSPDGRMIAYVVATPKRPSVLHVRNLGSTDSTPFPVRSESSTLSGRPTAARWRSTLKARFGASI